VFSVPYASVAQLLRPGMTRYALSAGKVDDSSLRNKPMLYQATWQHGINNLLTGYTGVTGFDDYQAFLVGTGMNTGIGALSFDVTHSRLKSDTHDDSVRAIAPPLTACLPIPRPASCWRRIATPRKVITT
jgi:outer membrane usher protein